jgi:hypothetical protein
MLNIRVEESPKIANNISVAAQAAETTKQGNKSPRIGPHMAAELQQVTQESYK